MVWSGESSRGARNCCGRTEAHFRTPLIGIVPDFDLGGGGPNPEGLSMLAGSFLRPNQGRSHATRLTIS